MSANRLDPSLPRLRRPVHPGAARACRIPTTSRQGNLYGMIGMAHRHRDDARSCIRRRASAAGLLVILGLGDRRRHRRGDGQARADDGDAAARGRLPLAGRPRRRARGGGARSMRRRPSASAPTGAHPRRLAVRDGARRRHRRDHLHRLGHRLPEARRAHVGQADHAAAAAPASTSRSAVAARRAARRRSSAPRAMLLFWLIVLVSFVLGVLAHHPDRRRRHAGRRLDAQLLFGLGRGRHRLHARQPRADHHRRAGRLVGRDPVLHHVQGR